MKGLLTLKWHELSPTNFQASNDPWFASLQFYKIRDLWFIAATVDFESGELYKPLTMEVDGYYTTEEVKALIQTKWEHEVMAKFFEEKPDEG